MDFEKYLRSVWRQGNIDFRLRVQLDGDETTFYIHALNGDSTTFDYRVEGNNLTCITPNGQPMATASTEEDYTE